MRRYASVSLFLAVALLCLTAFPASANNVVPPLGEPPPFRANNNNHWLPTLRHPDLKSWAGSKLRGFSHTNRRIW